MAMDSFQPLTGGKILATVATVVGKRAFHWNLLHADMHFGEDSCILS